MRHIILFLTVLYDLMGWKFFLLLWLAFSTISFVLICPALFFFWITPNIEKRYGKTLSFERYPASFPRWIMAPSILSGYIIFKLLKWDWMPILKNQSPLGCINFDVKTATRAEIIMSIISLVTFLSVILSMISVLSFINFQDYKEFQ